MNPPDNLPPLPPVPPGFDRWEYRGTGWYSNDDLTYATTCAESDSANRQWSVTTGFNPLGAECSHYIEAVREPAEVPACPECVQGYVQETGFDRCEKCNPEPASGDAMSDRPTPLTDAAEYHSGPDTCTAIEGMVDSEFARDLERKLAEAREALELADRLIAACGYMPTDTTRSKIKQALARIDANQQKP